MHFSDFAPCHYHSGIFDPANWSVPLVAIGWLEAPQPFPRGEVPDAVAAKLLTHYQQFFSRYGKYSFMGIYFCSFCEAELGQPSQYWLPQLNLFIPGNEVVYVTPGGIIHYIERHQYAPPKEFLDAALRCPPADSSEYLVALRKANRGYLSPLAVGDKEIDDIEIDTSSTSNPANSAGARNILTAVVTSDCACAICEEMVPANTPLFVAFDWSDAPPEHEPAHMHWDCQARWPHRQAFAEARLNKWIADEKESSLWATVWLDDTMLVMACPFDRFPKVCVLLAQTGTGRQVPLPQWSNWLTVQRDCPEGVHPVEAAALAAALPILQAQLPTAEVICSRVDQQAKEEIRQRQEQERAKREAAYRARYQAYNQHCAERWGQLTACPYCQGKELRFTDGKIERKSFYQCLVCGRSFGPDDVVNAPPV